MSRTPGRSLRGKLEPFPLPNIGTACPMTLSPTPESSSRPSLDLVESADNQRLLAFSTVPEDERSAKGQFGTPSPVARQMASLVTPRGLQHVRLLDPGAGVGTLTAAAVESLLDAESAPASISATVVEFEPRFLPALRNTLEACRDRCAAVGVHFQCTLIEEDFIEVACQASMFPVVDLGRFDLCIQNPPYKKIRSDSRHRTLLRSAGIEVSNVYAAFVALAAELLAPGGQIIAITPRSFCNGPYFKAFRRYLFDRVQLRSIHVFESRRSAFKGDSVLQENIIFAGTCTGPSTSRKSGATVRVSSSSGTPGDDELVQDVPVDQIVSGRDSVIQLLTDGVDLQVVRRMARFQSSLQNLELAVSTGRVVDFRAKPLLRKMPTSTSFPLIYPLHLRGGFIQWPVEGAKKANALEDGEGVDELLVPPGTYVLVKRFSSKEQRRRIEATLFDAAEVAPGKRIGFENHLNYFHDKGAGLDPDLAAGLVGYLNSSLVDMHFRLFSGHTQVNASDLKAIPYPTRAELTALGARLRRGSDQADVDAALEDEYFDGDSWGHSPMKMNEKVAEACSILKELGFPKAQSNERSGLVLLALLDLEPESSWKDASPSRLGITEMMNFFAVHYGKQYAPNSRETVRRQTVHQFLEAGLVVQNPDDPSRPTNSGKNVYEVSEPALELLRRFGSSSWEMVRESYLEQQPALARWPRVTRSSSHPGARTSS